MAAEVTYTFYGETYGGTLSENSFAVSLPAAARHVRWLCDGREPAIGSDDEDAYRRAVCAAIDAFAEFGEGQVGGFQLGDFKVTHYEDEGTTGDEIATQAALKELASTSLAFAGAGR